MVREFVHEQRHDRRHVTAWQVLDFFLKEELLKIPLDNDGRMSSVPFQTAYRGTRRWLEDNNYKRGKRTGNLVMKESVILHKHRYLQRFWKNRNTPSGERLREVKMDESYIHQHYHRNDDSIWDPSDE